jgi:hypothetical protein
MMNSQKTFGLGTVRVPGILQQVSELGSLRTMKKDKFYDFGRNQTFQCLI